MLVKGLLSVWEFLLAREYLKLAMSWSLWFYIFCQHLIPLLTKFVMLVLLEMSVSSGKLYCIQYRNNKHRTLVKFCHTIFFYHWLFILSKNGHIMTRLDWISFVCNIESINSDSSNMKPTKLKWYIILNVTGNLISIVRIPYWSGHEPHI